MSVLSQEGFKVGLTEWECGPESFISCHCDTIEKSADEVFVYHVSSALAGVILTAKEEEWVMRLLHDMCRSLPMSEREALVAQILDSLARATGDGNGLPRARVLLDLMDYLDENRAVHLEGFTRFRLKAYQKQIEQSVEDQLIEWRVRQEQEDFIELLRYFMASQDSYIDTLEVIVNRTGIFRLLDEGHNVVDNKYLETFVADLVQGSIDYGDLLISTLITLAPKQLVCHCEERLPVVETLLDVFAERMSICRGCEVCGLQHNVLPKGSLPIRPKRC
jgi:putative sporulation protein YtxC